MENNLYTIIEFDENEKWFVIGDTTYNSENYNYLIKVTPDEQDFIEDFMVVKCIKDEDDEYFDEVNDKDLLEKIMPLLFPAAKEVLKDPKKALKKLNN
jgi:hypothetical protein